jgi:hypothetical protein
MECLHSLLKEIDGSITSGDILCFKQQPAQQRQVEEPLLIGQVLRVRKITLLYLMSKAFLAGRGDHLRLGLRHKLSIAAGLQAIADHSLSVVDSLGADAASSGGEI